MDENIKIIDEKIKAAKEAADAAEIDSNESSNSDVHLRPSDVGTYYAPNGTSFIKISGTGQSDAECLVYMIDYSSYNGVCGYTNSFSMGTAGGDYFSATLHGTKWYYYKNGNISNTIVSQDLLIEGTYKNKIININGVEFSK